jgi:hypothetical protein
MAAIDKCHKRHICCGYSNARRLKKVRAIMTSEGHGGGCGGKPPSAF